MSPPRLRRTVAVRPWDSSRFWKAAIRRGRLQRTLRHIVQGNQVYMTWHPLQLFGNKRSACQSWSLTPSIMAYSKEIRRPVFSKYRWQASNSFSTS